MGIDPNLAFMGVCAVAIGGVGFAVHALRDITSDLLEAQRAADKAKAETRLAREEQAYGEALAQYNATLERYEKATDPGKGPINWKAETWMTRPAPKH